MFDIDFWQEVFESIRKQKLRSLMTAFGVFWGMLMLMFLIGAGMGFSDGLAGSMKEMPTNAVGYISGITSKSYGGLDVGRTWYIEDADFQAIERQYPAAIRTKILIMQVPRNGVMQQVTAGQYNDSVAIAGVSTDYPTLSPIKVTEGRFFDEFDCQQSRKVCILGEEVSKTLFPDKKAVGQQVRISCMACSVIGVMRKTNTLINIGPDESESIYMPITTAQSLYNVIGKQDKAYLVLNPPYVSGEVYHDMGTIIRKRHSISPEDFNALQEIDLKNVLNQFDIMTSGVNSLVWLVGLGTLLAGLIGIANIMLVTVKERTQEIGIRRALGADPLLIIRQIMCESLVLTLAAGVLGIIIGVWGLYAVGEAMGTADGGGGMFAHPHVPFVAAIASLFILIIGGLFAGWLPASRAMKIKAIEALREE